METFDEMYYGEVGRTMVTIHDGDAYTSAISNAFAAAFAVPVITQVTKGQTDMAAVLGQFGAADPEGMFVPLFPTEEISLIQQAARSDGLKGLKVIGGAAAMVTELLALPESEGVYLMSPDLGDSTNVNQATGRSAADVLTEFEATYGGPPCQDRHHGRLGNMTTPTIAMAGAQRATRLSADSDGQNLT